jgi:aryl-alcohol dehydrogenase-like predicted oxidoreductase
VTIATKGGLRPGPDGGVTRDSSPDWITVGVEASLRALSTDYIDVYQVHWPDPKVPFADTADTLGKLIADGKIRHAGVSNFDAVQMAEFSATLPVETLQPPYHLFRRDIEASILPYAATHDIGVLVYGPLAHGLLSGHLTEQTTFAPADWRSHSEMFSGAAYSRNLRAVRELTELAHTELGASVSQLAIAWTLANPAVHAAIVGTRDPGHVDEAIAAADIRLDDGIRARIGEIMRSAEGTGGPSPEGM